MDVDSPITKAETTTKLSDRYIVTHQNFELQYAQLYFLRLTNMRAAVLHLAARVPVSPCPACGRPRVLTVFGLHWDRSRHGLKSYGHRQTRSLTLASSRICPGRSR